MLKSAYVNHRSYFDETYDEEDFFNVASFQKRVSGREESSDYSGGTGLHDMIGKLIVNSVGDYCYMLTGNRAIFFKTEFLDVNDNGEIGFNMTNNFINDRPDKSILVRTPYAFPGTLYNLHFIKKLGDEYKKIAISFIQGFTKEIITAIGIEGFYNKITVVVSSDKLHKKFMDNIR